MRWKRLAKGSRSIAWLPGFIATEMVAKIPQPILDGIIEKVPIRRLGQPDEVARVVRFLLEDELSYITGAMYAVNGGLFM